MSKNEIEIGKIRIGTRFRKEMGDIGVLAESIEKRGLLHPVVVTPGMTLIAGRRRILAYKKLGRKKIPAHIVDIDKIALGQRDENIIRKNFTSSEGVYVADACMGYEVDAAAKRKAEAEKRPRRKNKVGELAADKKTTAKAPRSNPAERAKSLAAACGGMSRSTYEKAKTVVKAAETDPETFGPILEEMDKTGNVSSAAKKVKIKKSAVDIEAELPPLPDGPFRVIVVDPPWAYDNQALRDQHRGGCPYPPMSVEQICALPVAKRAHKDCILWLWTTNAHMREAFTVVDAWGFTQKTILTWVKNKIGLGTWLRGKTEHCLLAVRGNPTIMTGAGGEAPSTMLEGLVREHSRKPASFYELVDRICPGSKLELFARENRKGWVSHGNETGKF